MLNSSRVDRPTITRQPVTCLSSRQEMAGTVNVRGRSDHGSERVTAGEKATETQIGCLR